MPPATVLNQDAALKQIYRSGYFNDVVYTDKPLLALLPKFEGFVGRNMPVVIKYSNPGGRSQVFATALANITPSRIEDFLITRKHDYGVTQITGEAADAMESNNGSWLRGMMNELDGVLEQVGMNAHYCLYGDGSGQRGAVAGGGGTPTLTLTNISDIHKFYVGQTIDGTAAGMAGAPFGLPQVLTAVDGVAGTITAAGNWNVAYVATTDLFQEGDYTAAGTRNMLTGLPAWIPAVAPVPGALFNGVDRALDRVALAGLFQVAFGGTVEESLTRAAFLSDSNQGRPTHCFLNPINYRDLVNALGAKKIYNQSSVDSEHTGLKGVISFKSVVIDGPKGPIDCISDNGVPVDVAWMLEMDKWCLNSLGPLPKIIGKKDGNGTWLRSSFDDVLQVAVGYYGDLSCKSPKGNVQIAL